jgi:hypothetical protein
MATPSQEWRNILWREWRNCEDAQYAHYLFESLTGSGSIWFTPAVQIITGLFDNFGGLREVKWRNYDPSESAPFFVALILGSATGLVVGLISGAGAGLVAGLGIAALCFLLLMIILILIPKLRQRIGALFDRFYSQEQPANDEDIERFVVQVGNDTDPFRKPRYWQMTCTIGSACRLSENTLRILEKMFGRVELERVNP